MQIEIANTDAEIARCFPVLVQLRPSLTREAFVGRMRDLQAEGLELAYLEDAGAVRAVAGFRVGDMLARGRHLYVDDLVTDESARSRGYGAALFECLVDLARSRGCVQLDLDSGVQRHDAHRFYFRGGMHISGYHFMLVLSQAAEGESSADPTVPG